MIIRKNTKAFKTILQLITECQDRPDRDKLVRLYITKAGQSIQDRINIEGIQGGAALFYEMTYQTVLNNLKSSNHQLHSSDEIPGIYFFHSTYNKIWDETPFEFDVAIRQEFSSLPELPVVRKKEKAETFVFPAHDSSKEASARRMPPDKETKSKKKAPHSKKDQRPAEKAARGLEKKGPVQPHFKLDRDIEFTRLERVIFRQRQVSKRDVLEYYNNIAEHLLPYLKDRLLWTRLNADGSEGVVKVNSETLFENDVDRTPDWIKTASVSNGKQRESVIVCNDKEHLLLCVEMGCLEFRPSHSKVKNLLSPDYVVIAVDSSESELNKAVDVALAGREILDGLSLPSFVKTDGVSGLHLYIPLDSKSDFEAGRAVAEYICKLMRLKIPDLITFKGSEGYIHGKVSLEFTLNQEEGNVIAPYSLVGPVPNVATPLLWDEVKAGLRVDDFNHETIFARLKKEGDIFDSLFKKKVNADALVERLGDNYGFLF